MEYSPLRYLDSDVANLLNKSVKDSIEEKSRQFHIELYKSIHYYTEPYPVYRKYRADIIYSIYVTYEESELFLCDKISVKNIVNEFEEKLMLDDNCFRLPCGDISNGAQCMCDICLNLDDY